ncbi:hypothetical protein GGR53DRAFT_502736 [Hypoxylon sp. FL1150]|nr:hypothetical protein GGR53DRAFT_502736 [Hypoxylon sp. FL1150]
MLPPSRHQWTCRPRYRPTRETAYAEYFGTAYFTVPTLTSRFSLKLCIHYAYQMTELLGGTSGVAGLLSLVFTICQGVLKYYDSFKVFGDDIDEMCSSRENGGRILLSLTLLKTISLDLRGLRKRLTKSANVIVNQASSAPTCHLTYLPVISNSYLQIPLHRAAD